MQDSNQIPFEFNVTTEPTPVHTRTQFHKQNLAELCYAEIKHSDWMFQVMWLVWANWSVLLQHSYAKICLWHQLQAFSCFNHSFGTERKINNEEVRLAENGKYQRTTFTSRALLINCRYFSHLFEQLSNTFGSKFCRQCYKPFLDFPSLRNWLKNVLMHKIQINAILN